MASRPVDKPLVVIVGPTASGKTSLAIDIANRYDGEIICADSRTIYKGMDIGTAKPSQSEQQIVPHWGLDLVEPGQYYSAADFKQYANKKIDEIRSRGRIPILVGGTGLYIDAVIFDYQFGPPIDENFRAFLDEMSLDELHVYCDAHKITLPENKNNKRYVIRAIERNNTLPGRRSTPLENTIVVGITTDKVLLQNRIADRAEQIFDDGVVKEAIKLGNNYGWNNAAMTSNVYPIIHQYINKLISLEDAKLRSRTLDWQLAKRQLTWLKRNKFVQWFSLDEASEYLCSQLAIFGQP